MPDRRVGRTIPCTACLAGIIAWSTVASAQFIIVTTTQPDLLKLSGTAQGAVLAEIVRQSGLDPKCSQAKVTLEKTFEDGAGGWLVQCNEGQDHWVVMPLQAGKAAISLPCILVQTTTATNCYANFRTILPEHIKQCSESPFPDRVIGACTAIIQSERLAAKPEVLAAVYQYRAIAYSKYEQLDFVLADFDRAIILDPTNSEHLYNRAVVLERKGDLEQAIRDLNAVLQSKPDHMRAIYERGFVYLKKGDHDRAIDDFNRSISANPNNAKAYRNRGTAYKAKGEATKAEADLQKAKELEASARPPP